MLLRVLLAVPGYLPSYEGVFLHYGTSLSTSHEALSEARSGSMEMTLALTNHPVAASSSRVRVEKRLSSNIFIYSSRRAQRKT